MFSIIFEILNFLFENLNIYNYFNFNSTDLVFWLAWVSLIIKFQFFVLSGWFFALVFLFYSLAYASRVKSKIIFYILISLISYLFVKLIDYIFNNINL